MPNGQWEDTADLAGTEEFKGFEVVPAGLYLVSIEKNELGMSKGNPEEGQHPKVKAEGWFKVIAPVEKAGAILFENFTLATNDLPTRYDKTTVGARRWVTMMNKANVPTQTMSSLRMAAETSKGCQVVLDVSIGKRVWQGKEIEENNIKGFYATSERSPQFRDAGGPGPPATMPVAAPVAAPMMQQPVAMPPVAAAPAAPMTLPSAASMPVALPTAASPITPQPVVTNPPAVPMVANPSEPTVPCYSCQPQQQIPVSQYQQHMKNVHGQG